ncbi:MAG: PKD domain-containing protein [Euryarchaeota archaeon]|nr:PKD domain-containing protein [Euryarchaeota archaeon]MDE1881212.1 PKD domain-containing protein [Euryarchaeota archaeon]
MSCSPLNITLAAVAAVGFAIGVLVTAGLVPLHVTCPPTLPASQCNGYNGLGAPATTSSGSTGISASLFRPSYVSTSSGMQVTAIGTCGPASATVTKMTIHLGSLSFPSIRYSACGTLSLSQTVTAASGSYNLYYCLSIVLGTTTYTPCSATIAGVIPQPPPTVAINPSFRVVTSNLSAQFSDTSSVTNAQVSSVVVSFGDGSQTTLSGLGGSTSHIYARQGTYTATDTVTLTNGQSGSQIQAVTVETVPPPSVSPQFTWSANNLTAAFRDASTVGSGSILSISWSFGDGFTATGATPQHSYSLSGTYTVNESVTVQGLDGTAISGNISHGVTVQFTVITQNQSTNQPSPSGAPPVNPIGAAMMIGFGIAAPLLLFIPARWLWVAAVAGAGAGGLAFVLL